MSLWETITRILFATGSRRVLGKGFTTPAINAFAAGFALYHLVVLWMGRVNLALHWYIHLNLLLALVFLAYTEPSKKAQTTRLPVRDIVFAGVTVAVLVYMWLNLERFTTRDVFVDPVTHLDVVFGILMVLSLFVATRRMMGTPLLIVVMLTLLYAYIGPHLSGIWHHRGLSPDMILEGMWMGGNRGIWSTPIRISSTFVIVFLCFGGLLTQLGGGKFLTSFAQALVGGMRGGPAKVAAVSSGFLGSITSSPSANVATTGAFTIPMMKNMGYKPHFAGAVEAAASSGGLIMPPVMGAVVFVMSAVTGIPYIQICIAAALPAVLYYLGIIMIVHFEACRTGIKGLPKEELPSVKQVLKGGWFYLVPFVVIVWALLEGYSPIRAGLWGIAALLVLSILGGEARKGFLKKVFIGLAAGARASIVVAIGCACAGIIMSALFDTGLTGKFSSILAQVAGGNLLLALVITAIPCIILGMGVTTIAIYVIVAVTLVPAIMNLGVPLLAAHLFVVFYTALSFITPPVANAAFVAAGIAEASPFRIGFTACKLGIIGFVVPFMFAFEPSLLLMGDPLNVVISVLTASIGILALAAGFQGYLLTEANWWQRILLVPAGFALVYPDLLSDGIAIVVVIGVLAVQWVQVKKANRLKQRRSPTISE